jgi:hypothetical protein
MLKREVRNIARTVKEFTYCIQSNFTFFPYSNYPRIIRAFLIEEQKIVVRALKAAQQQRK